MSRHDILRSRRRTRIPTPPAGMVPERMVKLSGFSIPRGNYFVVAYCMHELNISDRLGELTPLQTVSEGQTFPGTQRMDAWLGLEVAKMPWLSRFNRPLYGAAIIQGVAVRKL